jgi:hypothetical protein
LFTCTGKKKIRICLLVQEDWLVGWLVGYVLSLAPKHFWLILRQKWMLYTCDGTCTVYICVVKFGGGF